MDIESIITNTATLSIEALHKLTAITRHIHLPKGQLLFHADKIEKNIYFISKGIARVYYYLKASEVTLCFATEGEALISLKSYVENKPGYENIELLAACELYQLKTSDLLRLYQEDTEIANWGRKLIEQEWLKTEATLMSRQFKTALERYTELIEIHPQLLLRVPLRHIASYLGVSQVTLSRIRAQVK